MNQTAARRGLAVLVGAGPGDPALLTAAGARWLSEADVVLYDRLANVALLAACRTDAEMIYVGKRHDAHALPQERINELLVAKCLAGHLVVRLKGGDPLMFGRGGEEADALAAAECDFRIVPGITAAIAAGAYAGIPLTDRRAAATVAFVTGHEDPAKDASAINYNALAGIDTVVFYMGVGNLAAIAERLLAAGRSPETPVAIVQEATTPRQRTITGTLATIAAEAERAGVRPPALTIVGKVVALRQRLAWLEKLPLFGRTVLVTRTRQQASELSRRLGELGAEVIEAPTIEIAPPEDFAPLDAALRRLGEFDWLALTSPNGAAGLLDRMNRLGLDGRALAAVRIAAVGSATAEVLAERFIRPDLVPEHFTTAALAEALAALPPEQRRNILLARANIATDELPDVLRAAGSQVEEVVVYRTVRPAALPADALTALRERRVDWITFTSSSTVDNFLALASGAGVDLAGVGLAAIGPVTATALRSAGLAPTVVAEHHTIEGLIAAIVGGG